MCVDTPQHNNKCFLGTYLSQHKSEFTKINDMARDGESIDTKDLNAWQWGSSALLNFVNEGNVKTILSNDYHHDDVHISKKLCNNNNKPGTKIQTVAVNDMSSNISFSVFVNDFLRHKLFSSSNYNYVFISFHNIFFLKS